MLFFLMKAATQKNTGLLIKFFYTSIDLQLSLNVAEND